MRRAAVLACLLLAPAIARADDPERFPPVPPPPPLPEPLPDPDPSPPAATYTVNGYVEAFYQYNFNRPSNLTTAYRAFDDRTDSITIANAVLDVTGTTGPVSVRIALQVGHTAATSYTAEPAYAPQAGTGASDPELWHLIQQALLAYKAERALFEAGIFLSPVGIENPPIKDQWNWSRSDLFFALPYYHAGARATVPLSDHVTGVAMVTNGWNDIVNRNPYPCVAGSLAYASDAVTVTGLYFGGIEPPTGAPEGQPWRNLFDATALWNARSHLAFAAQVDAGFEDNAFGRASWAAGAGYARVQALAKLYVAARYDYFHEHEPAGAPRLFFPANGVQSGTLTLDYRPAPTLSVRLEYRHDHATAPMYFKGTVAADATGADVPTARTQDTVTLGAVAWF